MKRWVRERLLSITDIVQGLPPFNDRKAESHTRSSQLRDASSLATHIRYMSSSREHWWCPSSSSSRTTHHEVTACLFTRVAHLFSTYGDFTLSPIMFEKAVQVSRTNRFSHSKADQKWKQSSMLVVDGNIYISLQVPRHGGNCTWVIRIHFLQDIKESVGDEEKLRGICDIASYNADRGSWSDEPTISLHWCLPLLEGTSPLSIQLGLSYSSYHP